jgi:hypothetical protein
MASGHCRAHNAWLLIHLMLAKGLREAGFRVLEAINADLISAHQCAITTPARPCSLHPLWLRPIDGCPSTPSSSSPTNRRDIAAGSSGVGRQPQILSREPCRESPAEQIVAMERWWKTKPGGVEADQPWRGLSCSISKKNSTPLGDAPHHLIPSGALPDFLHPAF